MCRVKPKTMYTASAAQPAREQTVKQSRLSAAVTSNVSELSKTFLAAKSEKSCYPSNLANNHHTNQNQDEKDQAGDAAGISDQIANLAKPPEKTAGRLQKIKPRLNPGQQNLNIITVTATESLTPKKMDETKINLFCESQPTIICKFVIHNSAYSK